jgi:hypothetical protein
MSRGFPLAGDLLANLGAGRRDAHREVVPGQLPTMSPEATVEVRSSAAPAHPAASTSIMQRAAVANHGGVAIQSLRT